jgi:hypothetical protein
MNKLHKCSVIACACIVFSRAALAECTIAEEVKALDPVEVGFCESDAVFLGVVDARMETIRAFRPEGSEQTKHFRTEKSTVKVGKIFKGTLPEKVTMSSELYDKQGAFSFEREKEYVVFARRLATDEYAGASAACSVQPTLTVADARKVIERLERHQNGSKKIDCTNISAKQ